VRVPHRDPRRDRKAIDRAARSRELTPEEQILALHSVIGNAAVAGLLGHGAATGTADAKGADYADSKSEAGTADAKGADYADSKSEAGTADAKGADYADGKGAAAGADGKAGSGAQDSKNEVAASTYEIDWLYELRTRKPRS
jgi:hypothetical protein